ncbi:MAG: type II toxin-antitoxin system VapC family toxin [Geminicoccaceae bacterium]|jgi:predicted nucleic-acid-binding protein|nr:type II toxin-antitoxin system VapC family toxin [Geminicoccaceae bacterium]
MRITVDTNVLVRAVLRDDEGQTRIAARILNEASLIAVSLPCLCELVWVLRRGARRPKEEISAAIRALIDADNVVVDRPAVEAGLALHDAGGDFADGVIAHQGNWLGGETFVTFDKRAVAKLAAQGVAARHLA